MATLRNRIELVDGVSPVLNKITQSVNATQKGFSSIANSRKVFDQLGQSVSGVERAVDNMQGKSINIGTNATQTVTKARQVINSLQDKTITIGANVTIPSVDTAALENRLNANLFTPANDAMVNLQRQTNNTSGAFSRLKGLVSSTFGQLTMANLAAGAIAKIGSTIASLPTYLIHTSDTYAGIETRLRLIVGEGGDVEAMNQRIYESAIRARGSYFQMADAVGKIAMTAKEAFPDPQQVVPFMEGIQKLFTIGGTGVQQQADALLQLTQALGSGKLQGDEFRSIAEAAPMIEQMVAKSLHVTTGALKQMSSDGLITAEVLKNAILDNMDTINAMFEGIPLKWSDIWQIGMTKIDYAMSGVYKKVNDLANSQVVRIISDAAVNGVVALAGALDWVMNNIQYIAESPATAQFVEGIISGFSEAANTAQWFVDVISQNMDYIFPVLMGLGVAVTALGVAWLASSAMAVGGAIAHAVASFMETAAIIGLIFAQNGLNAALAACPLTWIIGLIVLLIAVFYVVIAAVNRFAGTSISATGIIFMVFSGLFAAIADMIIFVINRFIDFANFLGSVFQDPLAAIYNLFADIWNGVVELVAVAVNSIISLINNIPGIDLSPVSVSGISLGRKNIANAAWHLNHIAYQDIGRSMKSGYDTGYWLEKSPSGLLRGILGDGIPGKHKDAPTQQNGGSGDSGSGGDGGGGAAQKTADNTGRMADSMDDLIEIANEARELASKEAVQHYTTQEIAVSVGDINPTIEKQQDVDGVIDQITEYILTGINTGAEAVHV